MIFIVNIEKCFKVLLLKVFNNLVVFWDFCGWLKVLGLIFGVGIYVFILKIINIVRVKKILFCIFLVVKKCINVWNIRLFCVFYFLY